MAGANAWTIGEVARRAGLRPSAMRYYEAAGLLPKPARVSGWRRYDASVFDRIAIIDLAQRAGFSLDEIRTLLGGFSARTKPSARWAALARKKLPDVEALIARAREMKRLLEQGIECGCPRLEDCPLLAGRAAAMAAGPESAPSSRGRRGWRAPRPARAGRRK